MEDRKQQTVQTGSLKAQRQTSGVPARTIAINLRLSPKHWVLWVVGAVKRVGVRLWRQLWKTLNRFEKALLLRLPKSVARKLYFLRPKRRKHPVLARVGWGAMALLLFGTMLFDIFSLQKNDSVYALSSQAEQLLTKRVPTLGERLKYDTKEAAYVYNQGYSPGKSVAGDMGGPKFTASFALDPAKGATITDSASNISMTMTPKFGLEQPRQDQNRLVYPIRGTKAQKIYSLAAIGVKEDILLVSPSEDAMSFAYQLGLPEGSELRQDSDGSVGIYGVNPALLGSVSTATKKDSELLVKARANGQKTTLLFRFPAPFTRNTRGVSAGVKTWFTVEKQTLTLHASGLAKAQYPLSIDPTIYVESAKKLMRGNNETNIDFDIDNQLIQKSQTTGARIDAWSSTSNLSSAVWGQGTAVAGGFIYSAGGVGSGTTTSTQFSTPGTTSFTVPAGVNYLTVKVWGGAGGGGAGTAGSRAGGAGGGGGYSKAVISVTPSEILTIDVGSGGAKASANGRAGNGGGYSAVRRSATMLLQSGGGGGGAGARGNSGGAVGNGGAGGGSSGLAGTASAGGAGGTAGTGGAVGVAGVANAGGNGTPTAACTTAATGTGGAGGTGGGASGGTFTTTCSPGGGGGGGRYGGGGGGSTNSNNRSGGGGGGGSSYINPTGLIAGTDVNTAGSGTAPGNSGDAARSNLADGGAGATTAAAAVAGENGIVVISYVTSGAISNAVYWAEFNTTTNAINSPNPGAGACSGWCTNSVYNLPTALTGLSLVAYNGFLYAIGGSNASGTPQATVYIAKLGANGEPQLWHPNGGTPVYWYSDTALSNARSQFAAVAYNNRMYLIGGLTTSTTVLNTNTVQYAAINPMGTLTTWTATGMSALTTTRYGLTAHVYNDTLYVLGGNASLAGTPVSTVEYAKLKTDGTMNAWVTNPNSIITAGRMTGGGSFSTIYGGYVYINGGCTAVNASGYCTSIASDVQLASINADGSLAEFNTILGLTNDRFAHTLIGWQGGLYRLGGCRSQDSITGSCTNAALDVDYGVINPEGEASTVANSVTSGTAPCSGSNPSNCDLPGVSTIGNVLSGSSIINGYLYIWGGCSNTTAGCGTVSRGVIYTSVGSDGRLTKPASCGTWTPVDAFCSNTTSLPTAVGAPATAIFDGYIYSVGGFTAAGSVGKIYYAQPSLTDGSISSWNTADLTTIGAEDVSYAYSFARANPSVASSTPGNLYILGGCGSPAGIGCNTSSYVDSVYKCTISTAGAPAACSKNPGGNNPQLQIGTIPGSTGTGLGAMAGTIYAKYIYLMGGLTPGQTDIKTTRYAKIDNNNNIVAVPGQSTWVESPNLTYFGRRRGSGFGYNGYLYVVGGYDGTSGGGVLADIEFAKINVSDGSIGSWKVSSVNIDQRWGLNLTVSNSYAYVIGGCVNGAAPTCNSGGQTNSIQTFQVYNNDSGAVAGYTAGNSPAADRMGGSSTILNGYIYYAGGCTDVACTTTSKDTYYAPIDAYGVVGTWSVGGLLPGAGGIAWGKLLSAGGTLYYVGGQTGATVSTAQSTVYYTTSISSGSPTWNTATKGITNSAGTAQNLTEFGAAAWNNRLYIVGGYSSAGSVQSTIYVSPQVSAGGDITTNWSSGSTAFAVARSGAAAVAYANNLYILGGYDGANYLSDVQYAQINGSTGDVGSWTYTTSLPNVLRNADGFAANGYLYLVGGRSAASTCRPLTLFAPVSANTTIATGNNPTGVGAWSETNQRYAGDRYGAAASYSGGRVYVLGGGCSSMVSSGDRMYSSTIKSQPQVAKYSRMIDTDSDVFPTSWLMNGLDNSIGARWQMSYSSMHDIASTTDTVNGVLQQNPNEDCGTSATMPTMTTWGQTTNVGTVTLGNVGVYTPKNSSGGNINCARYYYFSISIDSSQAFGYPDDITRGPTLADLSLFYTADPSKRMLHGKTFTGGEQQPLDTPCRRGTAALGDPNYNCPLP